MKAMMIRQALGVLDDRLRHDGMPPVTAAWSELTALEDAVWNAAIEAAAVRLEERAKECWGGASVTCGMMRGVYEEEVKMIRALKREAK